MSLFLGIDAGGTKTAFALTDEKGNILITKETGTIHPKQVSKRTMESTLENTIKLMVLEIGKELSDIKYTFAGVPGYGEFPELIVQYNKAFSKILGKDNYELGNDSVSGWAGSQAGMPGVNMVLGTGAIAYGMDSKGNEARTSGWGPYCGDEASAYWFGRQAIYLFAKQSDGRAPKSKLYDIIKQNYDLNIDFDFIGKMLELEDNRTEIAKLSMFLSKAAIEGDTEAEKIIQIASNEAALAINSAINKLSFEQDETIYVTYSGGVFKMGPILTDKIEEIILKDKRVKVIESILSPIAGSCLMALRLGGIEINKEVVENLGK